jgi:glutathione synthase/RimK-type ligase-like ATP-grasp enzyme
MSSSETTTDPEVIRKWTESRDGRPAVVKGTEGEDGEGILRIEFGHGDKLEDIEWDEFFETFEDRKLAFLFQDKTADGKQSRFFKFVKREA